MKTVHGFLEAISVHTRRFIALLMLLCAPLPGACATQVEARADPLAPVVLPPVTDADPALWKISDADTTIYVFGTIHVLKPGLGWFDEAVKAAFDASDELVLEIIEPEPAAMMDLVLATAIDQTGTPLRSRLDAKPRARYEKALASLGMAPESLDPFEPWMAAISMSMKALEVAGFDTETGVETALKSAAVQANKPVSSLETAAEQLALFDTLPVANQNAYLDLTVKMLPDTQTGMAEMIAIWSNGDTDGLARLLNEGFVDPLIYRTLLVERNARWAEWIGERMKKPGTIFMAVGAGHLAGPDSMLTMLEPRQVTVERVQY